jgi:hypothetical protein
MGSQRMIQRLIQVTVRRTPCAGTLAAPRLSAFLPRADGGANQRQRTRDAAIQLLDLARTDNQVCNHAWLVELRGVQRPGFECRQGADRPNGSVEQLDYT